MTLYCKLGTRKSKSVYILLVHISLLINCFTFRSVYSQNSINPRRSKSNLTSGVLKCPNVKGSSECKMPCNRDEHCENYGDLKCCPVGPGHFCKAECKEPVLSLSGQVQCIDQCPTVWLLLVLLPQENLLYLFHLSALANICRKCYDFEMDTEYVTGNLFVRDGVCCRCEEGGKVNCTDIGWCRQGCFYGSTYYNDGVAISRSSCRNCSCHNGTVLCTWNTNCTQEKCKYKGKVYTLEHVIRLDNGCKECVCQYRGWSCIAITCSAARSSTTGVKKMRTKTTTLAVLILLLYLMQS